ncbi:MAG: hypothetical protein GY953_05135 [bacterium]|nr:hypothetical protein [bacterium]
MTVTINLPPDKEVALKAMARAQGLTVEEWLLRLAERATEEPTPSRNLVDVCSMVRGLADDLDFSRNPSTSRTLDL